MHYLLDYNRFDVDVKNIKFTSKNGRVYPKTAIVSFFENKKASKHVELFGCIPEEELFKMIDNKEDIELEHCYIDHFSIENYRHSRSLESKEVVEINSFVATNCLFASLTDINFSYASFGDFSLKQSEFAAKDSQLKFYNSIFTGKADLSYVYFNDGGVDFNNCNFEKGISFKNSIFGSGEKDFQDTIFGAGDVNFVNTEFNQGDVSFINADFESGNVSFKVARFGTGKIDFHFAKFGEGDISFDRTEFGDGKIDFRAVEFNEGKVNFNRSVFGDGDVSFEGSQVRSSKFFFKRAEFGAGEIDFSLAEYVDVEFILDNTRFGSGNISFYNANIKTLSLKHCHLDDYVDLRLASCEMLDLTDTIVRDIIDMTPYEFKVNIEALSFQGLKLLGRIYIDWNVNSVKKLIYQQNDSDFRSKAEQFRILKENFNVTGHYVDEDKAYVEFKRLEAKAELKEAKEKSKLGFLWAYPSYSVKWLVFDKIGLYATEPTRVLFSMFMFFLLFSGFYFFLPWLTNGRVNSFEEAVFSFEYLKECLYYSGVTFFTIGYGDISPVGLFRAIAILEGFTGVFMMAYFTVAFVRKILR